MDAKVKTKAKAEIIKPKEVEGTSLLDAILEITVKDKDGKITEHRVQKSQSFVRQWLELLYLQASGIRGGYGYSIRDTGNVVRGVHVDTENLRVDAGATVITHGIVVGSGSTEPAIDDYALETQITHGVVAGQLQYSDMAIGHPAADATISQITVTRDFANGTGASVTVYEIGMYVIAQGVDEESCYFMVLRDVIAAGIEVPDGQTLTINYRLQAAV